MRRLVFSFVVFLAACSGQPKPPAPVALDPQSAQRYADLLKQEQILQAQYSSIQQEKETLRLKGCLVGKLDIDHCGPISPDGKSITPVVPIPQNAKK